MPITTDTLRNQKHLNLIFALSGIAFLLTTIWMMAEDQMARPLGGDPAISWKHQQLQFQANVATLSQLELDRYAGPDFRAQIDAARERVNAAAAAAEENPEYRRLLTEQGRNQARLEKALLAFNDAKSVLDVRRQDYERADVLDPSRKAATLEALREQEGLLARARADKEQLEDRAAEIKKALAEITRDRDAARKALAALERKRDTAAARLALNEASWTNWTRNTLLDFAVPTIQVKQVVLPDVRRPLNFLDTYETDRCQTCHIAIDRKDFTEEELVVSLTLALAAVNTARVKDGREPIALPLDLPQAPTRDAEGKELPRDEQLKALAGLDDARERTIRDAWDRLARAGDREGQQKLYGATMKAMNQYRRETGLPELALDNPLKAHPRLDLYVAPDSPHPVSKMGCTVCHGGNGPETSFTTAIHSAETHEQEQEWIEKYEGRIDYSLAQHWWNRPMLQKKYVEASCVKCHTGAAEVAQYEDRPLATRITQGRQLFTQLGCINCHKVEDLDASRRVGPDLTHVAAKLTPDFVQPWVYYPRDFRPSTWMPHFFKQENNWVRSGKPEDPDPDPQLRTETEVAAISHFLFTFSAPYTPEAPPEGVTGAADRGRELFDSVGCLACHAALDHRRAADGPTLGESWITADLVNRAGLEPSKALFKARSMTYGEKARYALEHFAPERREAALQEQSRLQWEQRKAAKAGDSERAARLEAQLKKLYVPPAMTRFAPELSGIGSKVGAAWLYDWLRNPRHYSTTSKMPSLRLSEQEAADVAAYLVTLKHDEFKPHQFELDDARRAMLDSLVLDQLQGQNSRAASERIMRDEEGRLTDALVRALKSIGPDEQRLRERIAGLDPAGSPDPLNKKLVFLGSKMISHYGCYACHTIPGFENASRPGTELTYWAEKSLNQIDFAFFEHMFEQRRGESFEHLYPQDAHFEHLTEDGGEREVHVMRSHASFGWHKIRNPRIWDRGKLKAPYEKLKMPNFYVTDAEADALTTYLLSRVHPNVTANLVPDAATQLPAIGAGRNLAAELNCVGCHNIEHNPANLHQFIVASAAGGGAAAEEEEEEEGGDKPQAAAGKPRSPEQEAAAILAAHGLAYDELNGPPWLRGEGAKVQHAWLHEFLQNVEVLRPWLKVRMPSFHLTNQQATALVQYFAASSRREADRLARTMAPVERYMASKLDEAVQNAAPVVEGRQPGDEWYREPSLKRAARALSDYTIQNRLATPLDYEAAADSPDMISAFARARRQAAFVQDLYDVHYPFVAGERKAASAPQFEAGREMLIDTLDCLACHALGDPNVAGANKNPTAPNLSLAYRRLRWEWVQKWLQEPGWIQPGTKMPQWFPGQRTAFADFNNRAEMEARYGSSGPEQIELLMKFLYEAGARAYTGVRGEKKPPAAQAPHDDAGADGHAAVSASDSSSVPTADANQE